MKQLKLFSIVFLVLFLSASQAYAVGPASVRAIWAQILGGSGSSAPFAGGTLTSNLTMSDGALIELATGSLANLGLRFRGDSDTGIWTRYANELTFVTGGTSRLYLSSGGLSTAVPLTVYPGNNGQACISLYGVGESTPAYTFAGDTDTGVGIASIGVLTFKSDGFESLRVASSGVLIATGSSSNLAFAGFTAPQTGFYWSGSNLLTFRARGTDSLTFGAAPDNTLTAIGTIRSYGNYTSGSADTFFICGDTNASSTKPTYSFTGDTLTGLGRYSKGQASIVASGTEVARFTETGTTLYTKGGFSATLSEAQESFFTGANIVAGGISSGYPVMYCRGGSITGTRPGFSIFGDLDTGLGRESSGKPSLISDGVECVRVASSGTDIFTALSLSAIATPTAASGKLFRSSADNHLYYCSDGSSWTKLD